MDLPADSQIIFELVDKSTNEILGNPAPLGDVEKSIPKKYRVKKVISAIINSLDTSDSNIKDQARKAFDQLFIETASERFLTQKAADNGIIKPWKLGICDDKFRKLVIDVISKKLTQDAFLSVLETVYGTDSIHAYIETSIEGPYSVFDGTYIDLLIDGKQAFRLYTNWEDYQNPLQATPQEICSAFNFAFAKNSINAVAMVKDNKVRIYSKTKGIQSSVSITLGTLQPYLQFSDMVFDSIGINDLLSVDWTISVPRAGVVRFTPATGTFVPFNTYSVLKIGDYVTIIGENFPAVLRGSYKIVDVNLTYDGSDLIQWFEIEVLGYP